MNYCNLSRLLHEYDVVLPYVHSIASLSFSRVRCLGARVIARRRTKGKGNTFCRDAICYPFCVGSPVIQELKVALRVQALLMGDAFVGE